MANQNNTQKFLNLFGHFLMYHDLKVVSDTHIEQVPKKYYLNFYELFEDEEFKASSSMRVQIGIACKILRESNPENVVPCEAIGLFLGILKGQ